ncbi:MAG: hypothetical protein KBC78_03150 [Candidatus Pacebacteria bacterium]|nr:hypothetical protein [Candidatus Paceibacterota bacterium]
MEIPKLIQRKIRTSSAKEGYLGAVKFFSDLTVYALGSEQFPHDAEVSGTISGAHNRNAIRNLLLLTRSATRMTGFIMESMDRPSIKVSIFRDETMVVEFRTVFTSDGKVTFIEPLMLWDMRSGEEILHRNSDGTLSLVD